MSWFDWFLTFSVPAWSLVLFDVPILVAIAGVIVTTVSIYLFAPIVERNQVAASRFSFRFAVGSVSYA